MLECYVDDGRLWSRDAQRRFVGCAAFVLEADERRFCERRWRHQLLRYELPALRLDQWPELVKARQWETAARTRALADFARVLEGHSVIGVYVAIDMPVWKSLDQRRRRLFRSPEDFCFLRVLRLVADRLEAASQSKPVQLVLPAGEDEIVAGAKSVAFAYAMDSRAVDRFGDVRFRHPRRCTYVQAVGMMTGRLRWQLAERSGETGRQPAWFKPLSSVPVGAELIGEHWNAAHAERYLPSLDWDVPDQRSGRRRRS